MTVIELKAQFEALDWVKKVINYEEVEVKSDGTKIYHANILEVVEDACIGRTVAFYVLDEGGAGEEAYYKDRIPSATIKPFMQKLSPLLKQYNGKIIDKGENWALVNTKAYVGSEVEQSQYFVEDGETLSINEVTTPIIV